MTTNRLDAVMTIENAAYDMPWTRGNFIDSLASGYRAQCLFGRNGDMLGYSVAMAGAAEMHLLNLTVAPVHQGHGHAMHMLDALIADCRAGGIAQLWLEVRASNARAREIYRRFGMVDVALRKAYYPAPRADAGARREDAVVMSLVFGEER